VEWAKPFTSRPAESCIGFGRLSPIPPDSLLLRVAMCLAVFRDADEQTPGTAGFRATEEFARLLPLCRVFFITPTPVTTPVGYAHPQDLVRIGGYTLSRTDPCRLRMDYGLKELLGDAE
jgi:hypothetical protein